jgi:hypothetical protein
VGSKRPTLPIPALLINQFDDVITWIGKTGHCGSTVEQRKSTRS